MVPRDDALKQGVGLQRAGRDAEALALYERLAADFPADGEVRFRLATALASLQRLDEALAAIETAVALEPSPIFRFTRADILERSGRKSDALAALESLYRHAPDFPPAASRLGEMLLDAGKGGAAVPVLHRAARLRPGHAPTLANLALAQLAAGEVQGAEIAAAAALRADPGHVPARHTLAQALFRQGKFSRAESELAGLCDALPNAMLLLQLANTRLYLGRAKEGIAALDRAAALLPPDLAQIESARLLAMHYDESQSKIELFEAHRAWALRHASPASARLPRRKQNGSRLRVGYVSARLHRSSPAALLAPVLESHDRAAFEIFCYACSDMEDDMTARLRAASTGWRQVARLDDERLAALMREDGIDIAVDLAGHTPGHRLAAFARRPAAVAVTWLDYFDTTGLDQIDAVITDAAHSPPGDERWHTEALVRLPGLRFCWTAPESAPALPPAPDPRRPFTFGSFNRMAKLSPATVSLWSRVLHAVPGSRLLLKSASLDNPEEHAGVRARFEREGIDGQRILLRGASAYEGMLAEYGDIDVALDSFPYNGCIVTLEALWMGRPVVTKRGDRMVARQTSAILECIGMEDLVAPDAAGFVRIAAKLARETGTLKAMSEGLRERMNRSPLMDTAGFTRRLEQAYLGLHSSVAAP